MRALTILLTLLLAAIGGPVFAGAIEVIDPKTGETFTYRPSFSQEETSRKPEFRFYDTDRKKYVEYFASQWELRERHRMRFQRAHVRFVSAEPSGTVVVDTRARHLYYVLGDGTAIRYGIGVARDGFGWSGVEPVTRKVEWPDWTPPAEMREREPWLPEWMPGGPGNPLGAAALYLGSTLYRIHGTHQDETIGYAVSSGCIRMLNDDIRDLFARVKIGARVIVLGPGSDRTGLMAAISPL